MRRSKLQLDHKITRMPFVKRRRMMAITLTHMLA